MEIGDHRKLAQLGCRHVTLRVAAGLTARRDPNDVLLEALYRAINAHPALDPIVKQQLHGGRVKSFTLSPLVLHCADGNDRLVSAIGGAPPGAHLSVRWTALDTTTLHVVDQVLDRAIAGPPLDLDGDEARVISRSVYAPPYGHNIDTYAGLFTYAQPATTITLHFTSPFVFRRGSQVVEPVDFAVRHFFGGYLERWSTFSPREMTGLTVEQLTTAIQLVVPADVQPMSRSRVPSKMPNRVYSGVVRFRIRGDVSVLKRVAALANYAWFCGTGTGTAWGLGQTLRI